MMILTSFSFLFYFPLYFIVRALTKIIVSVLFSRKFLFYTNSQYKKLLTEQNQIFHLLFTSIETNKAYKYNGVDDYDDTT